MKDALREMKKNNKSHYDPSRDTVGKIYRDLQLGKQEAVEIGDMSNAMFPELVDDINEGLKSTPFGDQPFYLMIHEKKDLQMKSAILRRILFFPYRPYPEDDTTVLWKDPKTQEVRFCWCLPHWSEMDNTLYNSQWYDPEYIEHIIAWKQLDLEKFGFYRHPTENWLPNPKHKDRRLESRPVSSSNILVSSS